MRKPAELDPSRDANPPHPLPQSLLLEGAGPGERVGRSQDLCLFTINPNVNQRDGRSSSSSSVTARQPQTLAPLVLTQTATFTACPGKTHSRAHVSDICFRWSDSPFPSPQLRPAPAPRAPLLLPVSYASLSISVPIIHVLAPPPLPISLPHQLYTYTHTHTHTVAGKPQPDPSTA